MALSAAADRSVHHSTSPPSESEGPDPTRAGMYHMAWEMASFEDLEEFHSRLLAHGANITGYSDRQCNVMFTDPDGNENEALWEPQEKLDVLPRLIRK